MKYRSAQTARNACLAIAALLFALPLSAGQQMSVRQIAANAQMAVATVRAYEDGQEISLGSGFFIRQDGVLVTNLHVVAGADSVSIEIHGGEIYDNVYTLSVDERRDLILLQIPASKLFTLGIADDRSLEVGDPVYVIGNPLGLEGTFSDGMLSAKRVEDGVAYLQVTAPISTGSSGGPVLNSAGQAVGVTTLTYAQGQNLNMAIPARHASDLLALAGEATPFETMAASLNSVESVAAEDRSTQSAVLLELLNDEVRAGLDEMTPYMRQVAVRLVSYSAMLEDEGWELTDDRKINLLESGSVDSLEVSLGRGSYLALGVCDDDCGDLDVYVLDSGGEIVASDILVDAEPMAKFEVYHRATFFVGASMESCDAENCMYSVQLMRQ
jgi:AcrR family transcriptional regulator